MIHFHCTCNKIAFALNSLTAAADY